MTGLLSRTASIAFCRRENLFIFRIFRRRSRCLESTLWGFESLLYSPALFQVSFSTSQSVPSSPLAYFSFSPEMSSYMQKIRSWSIWRSEEHTSELQSHVNLVCRLLLEKKKKKKKKNKNK